MKNIFKIKFTTILVIFIISFGMFSGCIEEEIKEKFDVKEEKAIETDIPSILPEWKDGDYHDYFKTTEKLAEFEEDYPDLVNYFSIGQSVLGKEIWCIKITNEKKYGSKYSCLIDGTIHGSEWEAGDACLYLAEYLLINFKDNLTIKNIFNNSEIYIIPMLNPDGRQENYRFNENGIDLNRNFDVDFGRLKGRAIPLGKLFGRIKVPIVAFPRLNLYFTNAGRRAFSEPETQALKDFMSSIDTNKFSFYVNTHTATHNVLTPWVVYKPPFEMKSSEKDLFTYVEDWIVENTEYDKSDPYGYSSGNAMDWFFKEYRVPSFIFEVLSQDYEPWINGGKHDNLVHWMKTTLPVYMFFLVNIENLYNWDKPINEPLLPEGVPPAPI